MHGPPASLADQLLVPSDRLRARLSSGIRASLIAGVLMAGASLADAISGDLSGLTTSRVLNLASLVPSLWIARTYAALGREAGRPSLGKGAWSVVGLTSLLLLIDLGDQHVLPEAAQALLGPVVAIGLILLPVLLFLPGPGTSALVAAASLTWAAQVLLATRAFAGVLGGLGDHGSAVASFLTTILFAGFFLWFGATKVRARRELGGMAAVLGWSEILGFVISILGILVGYSIALAVSMNAGEPEPSEKLTGFLDFQIGRGVAIVGLIAGLAWTGMTICLFLSIRRRVAAPVPGPGVPAH